MSIQQNIDHKTAPATSYEYVATIHKEFDKCYPVKGQYWQRKHSQNVPVSLNCVQNNRKKTTLQLYGSWEVCGEISVDQNQ